MPAQKTGGDKAKGRAGVTSKSARELWLNAVKTRTGTLTTGARKSGNPGKRSPEHYWTDTLRKSGAINDTGETFSGLKKPSDSQMAYLSTSHFLRQSAGTEKPKRSSYDPTSRSAAGTPAYKSQEEYYDETLALKKQVTALNADNSTLKARLRRVEDSHLKKEREIDQLLDPSRSEEMRRTLADKKPDAGATIHSLKQKILRLEQQARDKEAAYTKLQSDMKNTKVEEMKIQMEAYYGEIVRLQTVKAGELARSERPTTSRPAGNSKENAAKIKALNETVLRMNEKNVRLTQENKSLKEDLEKLFEEQEKQRASIEEYEDMNKKQLLAAVTKLEQRLEKSEVDNQSITSEIDERNKNTDGKVKLEGSMAQKLDQLDKRETELLAELEKVTKSGKKLKEDRLYYRKQSEDKEKEIKRLKREIDELQTEMQTLYDQDKNTSSRVSPRRPRVTRRDSRESVLSHTSARSEARAAAERERERQRKIDEFQKNRAAKHIQRGWKDSRRRKEEDEEEAAETIQSALRGHKTRQKQLNRARTPTPRREIEEEESIDEDAVETIQSAFRGHQTRSKQLRRPPSRSRTPVPDSEEEEEDEEAVETIQSAMRGHWTRKQNAARSRSASPRVTSARRSSRGKLDSAGEEVEDEDSDDMVVSSARRSSKSSPRVDSDRLTARRPSSGRKSPRMDSDDIRGSRRSLTGRKSPFRDEEAISSSRQSLSKSPRDEGKWRPSSARKSPVSFRRASLSKETPRRSSKANVKDEDTDDDDDICF